MAPFSIAIVGAGPAGLTLARILKVQLASLPADTLKISIFERDANMHSQTDQIGTLDLHEDTGMAAMKAAGLFEQFLEHARFDGEELVIADKNATELVHMRAGGPTTPGVEQSRPEIDREELVRVLLESVGKSNIIWNVKLERVGEDRILHFQDGRTEGPFDLIVGADGTWSKVRQLLTDVRPRYSGICGFESWIVDPNERHPEISKFLGRGAHFAFANNKGIMCHRLGSENIKVNFWMRTDQDFHTRVMNAVQDDEEALRNELRRLYSDWCPEYLQCIDLAERFRSRALWELPVGDQYAHKDGFVLVGDSAHLMTPFSGKGANAAMRDALELANAITKCLHSGRDLDAAVCMYEAEMFPRAHQVQRFTMMHKQNMYASDAPVGFMAEMMDIVAAAKGKSLNEGMLKWVPIKRTVYLLASMMVRWGALRRKASHFYRWTTAWKAPVR